MPKTWINEASIEGDKTKQMLFVNSPLNKDHHSLKESNERENINVYSVQLTHLRPQRTPKLSQNISCNQATLMVMSQIKLGLV